MGSFVQNTNDDMANHHPYKLLLYESESQRKSMLPTRYGGFNRFLLCYINSSTQQETAQPFGLLDSEFAIFIRPP
jgi:hypothetical protein